MPRWTSGSLAEGDVLGYVDKAAQRHRLKRLELDDVIPYSFECDLVKVVPVFDGKVIRGDAGAGVTGRCAARRTTGDEERGPVPKDRPPSSSGSASRPARRGQARSNRSSIITLSHAATKSRTNFSCASSLA